MIEPQQSIETAATRIARFDGAIALWCAKGYTYVTCSPRGTAQPHRAGQLSALLRLIAQNPGALLLELASPLFRTDLLRWGLTPRPNTTKVKDSN